MSSRAGMSSAAGQMLWCVCGGGGGGGGGGRERERDVKHTDVLFGGVL